MAENMGQSNLFQKKACNFDGVIAITLETGCGYISTETLSTIPLSAFNTNSFLSSVLVSHFATHYVIL